MIRSAGLVVIAVVLATGTARAGTATFDPPAFDFGLVPLSVSSVPASFSLRNTGADDLVVSSLEVSGPFACTNLPPLPLTLAPGAAVGFSCSFVPTMFGPDTGALTAVSNDPASPTLLPLRGSGFTLGLYALPSPLRFGRTLVPMTGQPGTVKMLALQSNINQPVVVQQIALTGSAAFVLRNPPMLPLTLPPMGGFSLQCEFTPTSRGDAQASIRIVSDAPNAPTMVALTGTGVSPTISAAPSVAFPDVNVGQVASSPLLVTNTGEVTLTVTEASFGGASAAEFSSATTYPLSIAPGDSAPIMLGFAPTVPGAHAATVTLTSDDPFAPSLEVTLGGRGTTPTIALTPDRLDFGDVVVGTPSATRSIVIANAGDGLLRITSVDSSSAAFPVEPLTLPLTLAPAASQVVNVGFAPSSAGEASAALTIASDDPAAPQKVASLGGIGTPAPTSDGGCTAGRRSAGGALCPALLLVAGRWRRRSRSAS